MRNRRFISILLTLCMALSLLPTSALAAAEQYTDVTEDAWYYDEVSFVSEKGYFKGYPDNTFKPNDTMTRAMFVTVMSRFAGVKVDDTTSAFTDVPAGEWYTGAITWAAKKGIVNGRGNGIFDPNGNVTREEMCTILDRYLEAYDETAKLTKTPATITDLDTVSAYAAEAVENCVAYGVITGYPDGTFGPKINATRAHVAAILQRLQLKVSGSYRAPADDYTADALEAAVEYLDEYIQKAITASHTKALEASLVYDDAVITFDVDAELNKAHVAKAAEIATTLALILVDEVAAPAETDAIGEVKDMEAVAAVESVLDDMGFTGSVTSKAGLKTLAKEIVAKAKEIGVGLRDILMMKEEGYNAYPFTDITVMSGEQALFVIDVANGFNKDSIDLPAGQTSRAAAIKAVVKAIAPAVYGSLKENTEDDGDITVGGELTLVVTPKDEDWTDTFELVGTATLTSDVVKYYYKDGVNNVEIVITEEVQEAYDAVMAEVFNVIKDMVMNGGELPFTPFALTSANDALVDTLIKDYMTPEILQALFKKDTQKLYVLVDVVVAEAIKDARVQDLLSKFSLKSVAEEYVLATTADAKAKAVEKVMTLVPIAAPMVEEKLDELLGSYAAPVTYALESDASALANFLTSAILNSMFKDEIKAVAEEKQIEIDVDEITEIEALAQEYKEIAIANGEMDKIIEDVILSENSPVQEKINEVLTEKLGDDYEDKMEKYFQLLELMTFEGIKDENLGGLATVIEQADKFDGKLDKVVAKIDEVATKVEKFVNLVPAGSKIVVDDENVITTDMIQALRDAEDAEDARIAVADMIRVIDGYTLETFGEGVEIEVVAGNYSVVVNLTITIE